MTTDEFWSVIEQARMSVASTKYIPNWLIAYLRGQSVDYIIGFKEQLHNLSCQAYDARLWAAACLMLGSCSDDAFTDFRGWLIAQGKSVYQSALEDPDTLAEVEDAGGDDGKARLFYLGYAPVRAYREKVGDAIADLPRSVRKVVLLNEEAWNGDQSKLPSMLPRLYAKYGGDSTTFLPARLAD